MMRRLFVTTVLALGAIAVLLAQDAGRLDQVREYVYRGKYEAALQSINNSRQLRNDKEARFLLALCYYQLNDLDAAFNELERLTTLEKSPYPECWLYLGKVYQARLQFVEAAHHYKLYLRTLRPESPNRAMVVEEIRRCDNGQRMQFQSTGVVAENLGNSVNTPGDEFGPVLSPNLATRLYFSAVRQGNTGGARDDLGRPDELLGNYTADMFSCRMEGGRWTNVEPLHFLLNSAQHEQILDFSATGEVLYYQQGATLEQGQIFADTFQRHDQRSLRTTPFDGPLQAAWSDQSPTFYYDTLVVFASRRPDGYGGLDLYRTRWQNGRWTEPENLGPTINTPYDETTPFLARDGRTLYFSTNDSRRSAGGLDVVRTVYLPEAARWSEPENLGFPLNSAGDDSHFCLARDGFTGFLASSRKDGYGQRDLYIAYFNTYRREMDPPVAGFVTPAPTAPPPAAAPSPAPFTPAPAPPPPAPAAAAVAQVAPTFVFPLANDGAFQAQAHATLLNQLHTLLAQHQALHAVVSVYHPAEPAVRQGLFPGIRQAEALAADLQSRGIAGERFFLRSLPHTVNRADASFMEVTFTHTDETPLAGQLPVVGGRQAAAAAGLPYNRDLCYKVQVVSVKGVYQNDALGRYDYPMVETTPGFEYYRYTLGACATFAEAAALRRQLEAGGFRGAYIVPFIYGERADQNRVKRLAPLFPDLANYLGGR